MEPKDLIEYLFKHSGVIHPTYTKEQHASWALGFLATIACEKNHMDNIVWARVKQRIDQLLDSNNI